MQDKKRPVLERQKETAALRFLYRTVPGRLLLKGLVNPVVSKGVGAFMNSRLSRWMIAGSIRKNKIPMERYEKGPFACYNDFFCRRLREAPDFDKNPGSLMAPCDGKLSVYPISKESRFSIKNSSYSVEELIWHKELASQYEGGLCLIFRLAVDDYHRYCYVDDAFKGPNIFIPGKLHTVQPIALERYDIYQENCRAYTVLDTANFGRVVQVEVGALLVGKIVNFHSRGGCYKGKEKGMFQFGGSTIVLLLQPGAVHLDEELLANTRRGLETVVKIGEKIGWAQKRVE